MAQLGSTTTQSSSSSNSPAASAQENGPLAFSHCMRSQGVPNFPDPNSSGEFDKPTLSRLAASSSLYQAAQRACQHLLPNTDNGGPTPAAVQQAMSGMVRFARCMRSDGVRDWPDPMIGPHGRPVFMLPSIDPNSAQVSAAIHGCQHLMPQSTSPYICSRALAEQVGGPGGAYACAGGSARVP